MTDEIIVQMFADMISGFSLVIIAWLLARYTINSYQKRKDDKDIKEKLLNEATELSKAYMEFFDKIGKWNNLNSDENDPHEISLFKETFSTSVNLFILNLTNFTLKSRLHLVINELKINESHNFRIEVTTLLNSMRLLVADDQLIETDMIHDYSEFGDGMANLGNIVFFLKVK